MDQPCQSRGAGVLSEAQRLSTVTHLMCGRFSRHGGGRPWKRRDQISVIGRTVPALPPPPSSDTYWRTPPRISFGFASGWRRHSPDCEGDRGPGAGAHRFPPRHRLRTGRVQLRHLSRRYRQLLPHRHGPAPSGVPRRDMSQRPQRGPVLPDVPRRLMAEFTRRSADTTSHGDRPAVPAGRERVVVRACAIYPGE